MVRIGVVSDTHVPDRAAALPPVLFEAFQGVAMILHAGDLTSKRVLDELEAIAPVYAVHGNMDPPELVRLLPARRTVAVEGVKIGLIHGHGPDRSKTPERALGAFTDVQCVVFGHTHAPMCERRGGVLLFNPGSPSERRGQPQYSYGILIVDDGRVEGEIRRFGGA